MVGAKYRLILPASCLSCHLSDTVGPYKSIVHVCDSNKCCDKLKSGCYTFLLARICIACSSTSLFFAVHLSPTLAFDSLDSSGNVAKLLPTVEDVIMCARKLMPKSVHTSKRGEKGCVGAERLEFDDERYKKKKR